jgi:hypothetical protein
VRHFGTGPAAGDHLDQLLAVEPGLVQIRALPGERGSPRPSPFTPWQNWQSALSRYRRWPNDASWAPAKPLQSSSAANAMAGRAGIESLGTSIARNPVDRMMVDRREGQNQPRS